MGALWAGLGGIGQASLLSSVLVGNGSGGNSSGGAINPSIYQGNKITEGNPKTESNYVPSSNQVLNNILPTSQNVNFSGDNSNNFQNLFEQEELKRKMAGLR